MKTSRLQSCPSRGKRIHLCPDSHLKLKITLGFGSTGSCYGWRTPYVCVRRPNADMWSSAGNTKRLWITFTKKKKKRSKSRYKDCYSSRRERCCCRDFGTWADLISVSSKRMLIAQRPTEPFPQWDVAHFHSWHRRSCKLHLCEGVNASRWGESTRDPVLLFCSICEGKGFSAKSDEIFTWQ